jgi:hypothetical protein
MDWITEPQAWIGFATLTLLEVVLGIDNIVFISILTDKLPGAQQSRARLIGLALAMVTRILLLFSLTWIIQLTAPLFVVLGEAISGRDLVLILGGLFLLAKSTHEIHGNLEGEEGERSGRASPSFVSVLIQIMLLARLGDHRRGDGGRDRSDGVRCSRRGGFHDVLRRIDQPLRQPASNGQNPRPQLPADDRCCTHC